MGVSVFPIIEGDDGEEKIRHLLKPIEWKDLSDCTLNSVLTSAAAKLGVTPIGDFMSSSRQDALESMGEEEVEEHEEDALFREGAFYHENGMLLWTLEKQWFEPREGLQTVRTLIAWINDHPQTPTATQPENDAWPRARAYHGPSFVAVLRALESILVEAQSQGKRFYLSCNA